MMPFHGHIVSASRCPTGLAGLVSYDAACAALKRPFCCCHLAHSRSTLQWSRKKSGSLAAVPMLEIEPPQRVWAVACGLPSIVLKAEYWAPRANVWASLRTEG